MKDYKAKYSNEGITYWPLHSVAKFAMLFPALGVVIIAVLLWCLYDSSTFGERITIIIEIVLMVIVTCWTYCFCMKKKHDCYTVSQKGINYKNKYASFEMYIAWDNVVGVYFVQNHWNGSTMCEIIFGEEMMQRSLMIPVLEVDDKKLLQFLPKHLWKNNPWT